MCNRNRHLIERNSENNDPNGSAGLTAREAAGTRLGRGASEEVVSLRTANTKTFENEDHSFTKVIYFDAVHYQDEDGRWQDMDDTLAEETKEQPRIANHKGSWEASFPKAAGSSSRFSIRDGENVLSWYLELTKQDV